MTKQSFIFICMIILTCVCLALPAHARVTVYQDGEKTVTVGGTIQVQYHLADPSEGESSDRLFLRRLMPFIEGTLHEDWMGRFQIDFGNARDSNEVVINDAYMRYRGLEAFRVTVGNLKFPFSREILSASAQRQLVETTFSGNRNYGTPARNLGVHLTGGFDADHFTWGASLASATLEPDVTKVRFGSPANQESDFNEGFMFGGRLDWHPLGYMGFNQGDFNKETRLTVGLAAYAWNNDGDNNTFTDSSGSSTSTTRADIDNVAGIEVSGAFKGGGFYFDSEYNKFLADTVDNSFAGGIFVNGSTDLTNWHLRGGYMIIPNGLDLVLAYQRQNADGYDRGWNRASIGSNWYIRGQDIKLQLAYQVGSNLNGVDGKDQNDLYFQAQFVF